MFIPTGFLFLLLVEVYNLCVTGVCSTESCYCMLVRCLFDVFLRLTDCLSVLGKCSYSICSLQMKGRTKEREGKHTCLVCCGGLVWFSLFYLTLEFSKVFGFIVRFVEIWLTAWVFHVAMLFET